MTTMDKIALTFFFFCLALILWGELGYWDK